MVKRWFTVGLTSGARSALVPALLATTVRVEPELPLSSAAAHPEQIKAPEGNEDQSAGTHSQQQDNRFQHDRITPLVTQKHARLPQNCHHSVPAKRPDETIFRDRRKHPETKGRLTGCQQNRDGRHAVHIRPYLEPVTHQIPRHDR
jgi:hypothetical protein